jgi:hypothetical protein
MGRIAIKHTAAKQERSSRKQPQLYAQLKMLDAEWLRNSGTQKSKPRHISVKDWEDRDQIWATRLSRAISQLHTEDPSGKLSATKVITKAGLKLWILSKPNYLPECHRVLARG